jgi:transcriptional regulator with XRE-family HTH domain
MKDTPLKSVRRRARLTALALAEAAGTTEARVFQIEQGRYRPRPNEAKRLADVLGATVADFFPGGTQTEVWK